MTDDIPRKIETFEVYESIVSPLAFYPDRGLGTPAALAYCGLGLTGEAGEFAEKVKKWLRDGDALEGERRNMAALELGDVLWYITAAANELGLTLRDIAEMNADKLLSRAARGRLGGSGDAR